jgi:hypothetical protein
LHHSDEVIRVSEEVFQNGKMSDPQDRPGFVLPSVSGFGTIGAKGRVVAQKWHVGWKAA